MGTKRVKINQSITDICHSYAKYRARNDDEIEQIDGSNITQEDFFEKYIKARRPVKFTRPIGEINTEGLQIDKLVELLKYEHELKVEKKYKSGFGSGLARENIGLKELVEKFEGGDDKYYLTTQYDDDHEEGEEEEEEHVEPNKTESDEDEEGVLEVGYQSDTSFGSLDVTNLQDDFEESDDEFPESEVKDRVRQLFQPPLTNMYDLLPLAPQLLSMLIPQQINLWMGYSKPNQTPLDLDDVNSKYVPGKGNSSGLHHDHADNLYILISGSKRFTLYSPYDADKMYTVGQIYKVYNSGVIDYERDENAPSWQHVRDDGAIVRDAARWQLSKDEVPSDTKKELLAIIDHQDPQYATESTNPPSFSKVPPVLLHLDELEPKQREKLIKFGNKHFPGFLDAPKMTVWLKPGEMLYLPTGWFHEVSSFGSESAAANIDNVHIALNYWFVPPNGETVENVYCDAYWREDYERTIQAIEMVKLGAVSLD